MKRKMIIHDLSEAEWSKLELDLENTIVIPADGKYAPCKGCFGCWLKTPGKCVMKDKLQNIATQIVSSDELIIISENCYGGYSSRVKNVIDRSIATSLPFFAFRNKQIHHARRYPKKQIDLVVYLYGDMTEKENKLAEKLITANGINAAYKSTKLHIVGKLENLKEMIS